MLSQASVAVRNGNGWMTASATLSRSCQCRLTAPMPPPACRTGAHGFYCLSVSVFGTTGLTAPVWQGNSSQVAAAVKFADANWNCLDVLCKTRVPKGSGQPVYGCAPFVAHCLAAAEWVPR